MGYTTYFTGEFTLDKELTREHQAYLEAFAATRRMKRDPELTATLPDPVREAAGLPVGEEGCYYVGASRYDEPDVLDCNQPPEGQPGLWCQWVPGADGLSIAWDDGEKFYEYIPWIKYLIDHFLGPWGYTLSGEVRWQGEDSDDEGIIKVEGNRVYVSQSLPTSYSDFVEVN